METLSRVKRYEDLRKQIEDDSIGSDTLPQEQLQDYAQRLNELDSSIFKKVNVREDEPYTPERERKDKEEYEVIDHTMDDFRNEYLDDFINEVREYNIKKGNRENENTQIDILNRLNSVSRAKRSDYIEKIDEDVKEVPQKEAVKRRREDIAAQVKSFVEKETPSYGALTQETEVPQPTVRSQEIVLEPTLSEASMKQRESKRIPSMDVSKLQKAAEEETLKIQNSLGMQPISIPENEKRNPFITRKGTPSAVPTKEEQEEAQREKLFHQKLVEETQQLRVQMNEYEDDLNDLSEGVEKTNKMLNIILGCLILALLVIVGIVIYWIIQAGGMV